MAAYVDYDFYSQYSSAVKESDFARFELKARLFLDWNTFNRLRYRLELEPDYEIPENIRECMVALIDHCKEYEDKGSATIASETVSKHSVTYIPVSEEQEIKSIVGRFLGGTAWTYRGGGAGPIDCRIKSDDIQPGDESGD